MTSSRVPYLTAIELVPNRAANTEYPFNLPAIRSLKLRLTHPVTFFVGENGAGKSTVIEAIAELCGLPASGGGRNELGAEHGPESKAALTKALRPSFKKRPRDGYFFRAEFQAHFASLLDQRHNDPDFIEDPYARYGGRSLLTRSHGEAFLTLFQERIGDGLYLFDEPESALSPQRQLTLLAYMNQWAAQGSQFIVDLQPFCNWVGLSIKRFEEVAFKFDLGDQLRRCEPELVLGEGRRTFILAKDPRIVEEFRKLAVNLTPQLRFAPINLDLHSDVCVRFRADSYVCSFGADARFYEEAGKNGETYLARIAERMIRLPGSCLHVWQDQAIVGQIEMNRYKADPSIGYVNLYYLAPEYRDQGYGRSLDDYAISYLKSLGFSTARLSVSPTNLRAFNFYTRQGWTDLGPRSDSPEVHLMERNL